MANTFIHNDIQYFVGDTIKVNYKIKEKDKERVQAFDGILIGIQGTSLNRNIIVKKDASDGITVERIFPVNSPLIDSIKRLRTPKSKIHRAKLYYLRDQKARKI